MDRTKPVTKEILLDAIRIERARWDDLLRQIGDERMTEPGAVGEWSVKNLIAHVAWSEREATEMLEHHQMAGSALWSLSEDERNHAVYEQNRDRPLADVRAEADESSRRLLAALDALPEADLHDPSRFAGMPAEWLPWKIVDGCSAHHYHAHLPSLRTWLTAPGSNTDPNQPSPYGAPPT